MKQHQNIFGIQRTSPIIVIYDGKAPYESAWNLWHYIQTLGFEAKLINEDEYQDGEWEKIFIIGHHSLSKECIKSVDVYHNIYGMSYGFKGKVCVLKASRSELGRGKKGRKEFSGYYNSKIDEHYEFAKRYGIPLEFGKRDETRKSQYDLLLAEFIKYGIKKFLGITDEEIENIALKASDNLKNQIENDKEMGFTLEDILQNYYEENQKQGMEALCDHLGKNIIFTDVWDNSEIREVQEHELMEGEISASIFRVGNYIVRSSKCLYKDIGDTYYTDRIPAEEENMSLYRENKNDVRLMYMEPEGTRFVHGIFAKYVDSEYGNETNEWKFICIAATSVSWDESIDFIATVSNSKTTDDEKEMLFVLKNYTGSSHSVAYWYKFMKDGTVTEYSENPYDEDSYHVSWK